MNHLVVSAGEFHISLWPQEIQPRGWENENKEQTNNMGLGQLKVQEGWFCDTAFPVHLYINANVYLLETSTSNYKCQLISGRLPHCWPLSTQDCELMLSVFPTTPGLYLNRLVFSVVRCRLPVCVTLHQLPSLGSFFQLLLWCSFAHFRSRQRSRAQAFVWFCAKIDKGIVCLADHPHSVTYGRSF